MSSSEDYRTTIVNISLSYVKYKDKYLLVQERDHSWFVPAGRVEKNETFHQGAQREAREESSVDIKLDGIIRVNYSPQFGMYPARMLVYFWATPVYDGSEEYPPTKTEPDEHTLQAKWFTVQEIEKLNLRSQSVIEIIRYIESSDFKYSPIDFIGLEGESWWSTEKVEKKPSKPSSISAMKKKFFN